MRCRSSRGRSRRPLRYTPERCTIRRPLRRPVLRSGARRDTTSDRPASIPLRIRRLRPMRCRSSRGRSRRSRRYTPESCTTRYRRARYNSPRVHRARVLNTGCRPKTDWRGRADGPSLPIRGVWVSFVCAMDGSERSTVPPLDGLLPLNRRALSKNVERHRAVCQRGGHFDTLATIRTIVCRLHVSRDPARQNCKGRWVHDARHLPRPACLGPRMPRAPTESLGDALEG